MQLIFFNYRTFQLVGVVFLADRLPQKLGHREPAIQYNSYDDYLFKALLSQRLGAAAVDILLVF